MELLQRHCRQGRGIALLDGGQATHLETLGFDVSESPLWSASLLTTALEDVDGQRGVQARGTARELYRDYLAAGASMVGTLTYQLSDLALQSSGSTGKYATEQLMEQAMQLALEGRDEHVAVQTQEALQSTSRPKPLISLTLGPYGAALANGSEYTGDYGPISHEQLVAFHRDRLAQASRCQSFSSIGAVAFETIPRLDEAEAIFDALEALANAVGMPPSLPPAYISFVFPPEADGRLPYTAQGSNRPGVTEITQLFADRCQTCPWPVVGIGINCTKPWMMARVSRELTNAVRGQQVLKQRLFLFLYPDGGLVWDGTARCWVEADHEQTWQGKDKQTGKWAQNIWSLAHDLQSTDPQSGEQAWKGVWLGGCCKTGPNEIRDLNSLLSRQ